MKKLFLSVLAAALTVCSIFGASASAAFSDVDDGYEYRDAVITLNGLHIIDGYDDNTFRPLDGITRAEFTKMLVCTMGFGESTMTNTAFSDVSGHWAETYITSAVGLNVVSGFDDGTFRPGDPVTYEQCLTMLVRALGYDDDAVNRGGYPAGYINTGLMIGLTSHVSSAEFTQPASRGMVAQLIYNSLEIPLRGNRFVASNEENTEESTFLNTYLKLRKINGTVIGVEDYITNECKTDLYPGQMDIISKNQEYILDFSQYTQNVTDINKYLGQTVTIYYKQLSSSDDLILVSIDNGVSAGSSFEVFYKDIISYDSNSLKYYDNSSNSIKSAKINPAYATIRYNGRIVDETDVKLGGGRVSREKALSEWLDPDSDNFIYGDVSLTVSSDGNIKLIQINDYDIIVALKAPLSTDYRIMDKLTAGNYITLDPNSSDYTYTITKDGSQIPVTSIAANDVILYAESLDGDLYTVIDTAKTVQGTISSTGSNGDTATIDGTKYDVSPLCESYISNNQSGQTLKPGAAGTFYLDKYNTIIFGTITEETAFPYAYIANAFIDIGTDECYATVFAQSKNSTEAKTYKLKNKVKFNGSNIDDETVISRLERTAQYNNADDDEDWASDIYGRGQSPKLSPDNQYEVYSQIARVGFDGNEISSIVTLDNELEGSSNENKQKIVRQRELGFYEYRSNSFSSNGTNSVISTNSSTVVICVPQDRTNRTGYAQKTVSSAFDDGESYYVEAYDVNSSRIAGLLILYSGGNASLTNVTKNSGFAIVADYANDTTDSASGAVIQTFPVFWGPENSSITSTKTWDTYDDYEFNDVKPGDVIQFAYNAGNQIQNRIDNIRFSDIEKVLDKNLNDDGLLYDWTEPADSDSNQEYKFDYRFRTRNSSGGGYSDEMYTSSSLGSVPYARACMYNVVQVIGDTNQIYVTKHGFDSDGQLVNNDDYEVVNISSSTKFLRMEENRESFSTYAEGTSNTLSLNDLLDVQYYGSECSKILVCSQKGEAKLIVIYR